MAFREPGHAGLVSWNADDASRRTVPTTDAPRWPTLLIVLGESMECTPDWRCAEPQYPGAFRGVAHMELLRGRRVLR